MMKKFTFKRQLLLVMLMLLGCLSIQAADDGLITNQVVITLDRPGTLPQKISASDKYLITNLKVKGDINGTDLGFLREMAGQSINGEDETDGKLSTLDLSDTKIVGGGEPYFNYGGYETYFTEYNKIGKYAFCSCNNLKRLTLPKDITSIEQSAFFGCSGLTSITIPSSVTAIGKWSFYDCQNLSSVKLPSEITAISNSAFGECISLKNIELPAGITSIGDDAFVNCSNLQNINLPSGITTIGTGAFWYCSNLTNVILPSALASIGAIAFANCSNLANVTLSSNITSIGYSAFSDCNSLKNLTISKDVTSIKDIRFYYEYDELELESVYVAWQNPIEAGSFFNRIKISNCTLYVPQGTKEAYANADVWKDFGNIIEYDATGIDKVTNRIDVKEISRYSLNGQRVTSPTKGVNIVVYSDGSIKKVAVQ
ncbi:leucine-rich repeat domain-containing protein [Segatella hominis]|uniref:leucine-rich repeat domain-containing protein n=1 Tax=Segatella hominis TaxID=2518605 RepID=UPI003AB971CB